ncbi:MAG TPA: anti-sigma factor [Allosphingosinicella sp.]|jgi:anti-sigma-K factor RskA
MSADDPVAPEDERDLLAAEYALGLLDGGALAEVRRLEAADEGFARAVAQWQERLMPLAGEAPAVVPDPALWDRVRRAIGEAPAAGANVVALKRRLRVWRTIAVGALAAAASLALVVGLDATTDRPAVAERQPAAQPERPRVLVAALASPEEETSLSVAYDLEDRSLVVTPGRLTGAAGHDHELWVIPAGGAPVSLGLVRAGEPQRFRVPVEVAPHFRAQSAVALSVEPTGGSPTGRPTGPVVASGALLVV